MTYLLQSPQSYRCTCPVFYSCLQSRTMRFAPAGCGRSSSSPPPPAVLPPVQKPASGSPTSGRSSSSSPPASCGPAQLPSSRLQSSSDLRPPGSGSGSHARPPHWLPSGAPVQRPAGRQASPARISSCRRLRLPHPAPCLGLLRVLLLACSIDWQIWEF